MNGYRLSKLGTQFHLGRIRSGMYGHTKDTANRGRCYPFFGLEK